MGQNKNIFHWRSILIFFSKFYLYTHKASEGEPNMRITNKMMTNNMMNNINKNKNNLSTLDEQYSTGKKIQRPSEDPIIAVRALKLRTNLSELNQYLDKNIPDAMSWMDISESALKNMNTILTNLNTSCGQGASDPLSVSDRNSIVANLEEYKQQIYQEGNTDYAGRYVFTGYKTDTSLSFIAPTKNLEYAITEKISGTDIDEVSKVKGQYSLSQYKTDPTLNNFSVAPSMIEAHRIRLAYDNVNTTNLSAVSISYSEVVGAPVIDPVAKTTTNTTRTTTINTTETTIVTTISVTDNNNPTAAPGKTTTTTTNPNKIAIKPLADPAGDAYTPTAGTINLIPETGELILAEDVYQSLRLKEDISVKYEKKEFKEGDLRPEHYFDCTVNDTQKPELGKITYTNTDQQIQYEINFNQKLTINTQGSDAIQHGIGRDIDEILEAVKDSAATEGKIAEVKKMMEVSTVTEAQKASLTALLGQLNTELVLKNKIVHDEFGQGISGTSKQQNTLNVTVADLGSRYVRLELTESRLSSQQSDFEELLSTNEDADVVETYIKLNSAETIYNASLSTASKIVKNTLLDFL